jgi:hypothetical protein
MKAVAEVGSSGAPTGHLMTASGNARGRDEKPSEPCRARHGVAPLQGFGKMGEAQWGNAPDGAGEAVAHEDRTPRGSK